MIRAGFTEKRKWIRDDLGPRQSRQPLQLPPAARGSVGQVLCVVRIVVGSRPVEMTCPCCSDLNPLRPYTTAEEDAVLACWDCTHNINGDPHLCATAKAITERRGKR